MSTNRISTSEIDTLFNRETDTDWDKDLAEDVKRECEEKYGKVAALKVEPQSKV